VNNYAFVASTLPLYVLNKNITKWGITKIILASNKLYSSYEFLIENHPNIDIVIVPKGRFRNGIYILWKILRLKLKNRDVFFFHECCWVFLDLMITFVKPKGQFFPQVTMSGNPKVMNEDIFKIRFSRILNILGFYRMFNVHNYLTNSGQDNSYCYSLRTYPKSIIGHNISSRNSSSQVTKSKKVLFIVGNDFQNEEILILLKEIINQLLINKYTCFIKDHPREEVRLNITNQFSQYSLEILDPNRPVELLLDDYLFVIGSSSTALLYFGNRAISLINLMSHIDIKTLKYQKKHLVSMPGGEQINFIEQKNEIFNILNQAEIDK